MPPRLLILEDDDRIRAALRLALTDEGYDVRALASAEDALAVVGSEPIDLMLVDLMLGGMDGFTFIRTVRPTTDAPIIVLSARADTHDIVAALEAGADDYVTKPYSARELIARIRAVLRRGGDDAEAALGGPAVLAAGPVRMDVERHTVTVAGEEIPLPLKEFDLLEYLLRNVGRVLTRGQLIDRVWGADYVGDTKTLDVHVKRLRAKIEPDPSAPQHLLTVRGLGYKYDS